MLLMYLHSYTYKLIEVHGSRVLNHINYIASYIIIWFNSAMLSWINKTTCNTIGYTIFRLY